jgi:polyhydroxyalkanoate synthesis regulator phasin
MTSRRGKGGHGARAKVSDGIKQGIGVLSAFKDALEETINEARERGDLSAERAKEVMKDALSRAQEAAGGAKERLDFVTQREFDALGDVVEGIRGRVAALEDRLGRSTGDTPAEEEPEGEHEEEPEGEREGEKPSEA